MDSLARLAYAYERLIAQYQVIAHRARITGLMKYPELATLLADAEELQTRLRLWRRHQEPPET
ncbi:MAG: hypothetical protein LBJ87_00725 [bacterium]|jgi:hypothetical protein|nr:hypothetical protein [bacterium]